MDSVIINNDKHYTTKFIYYEIKPFTNGPEP
jgi:hypothetical protein